MLECQTKDRVHGLLVSLDTMLPVSRALVLEARAPVQACRVQTLNPVRAVLDRVAADGAAFEATADFALGFDEEEVGVAMAMEGAGGDDSGDAGAEDEDAGLGRVGGRVWG